MAAAEDRVDAANRAGTTSTPSTTDPTDEASFRSVYDQHLPEIWRFVRRRCDGAQDADDVTAEVFAVAWRRRRELPPAGETRLWLFGVARRVLANHHRSVRRRERLHLRLADGAASAPTASPGPGEEHGAVEPWAALAVLSEEDRELLLLRSWDGLPVQDLAVILGCTPNAASLRLHKARRRLAGALERGDGLDPRARPAQEKEPITSRTSPGRPTEPKEDTP